MGSVTGAVVIVAATGLDASSSLAAHDYHAIFTLADLQSATAAGSLVTAGDVVFQGSGTGDLDVFDARSGQQLLSFATKSAIYANPLTYQVNGRQYVTVVGSTTVFTFGLP
jgi:hypothetical protein